MTTAIDTMQNTVFNSQNRKSGGYKKAVINVGTTQTRKPILSIQCFENRHLECNGVSTLGSFPAYTCECEHHVKPNKHYACEEAGAPFCQCQK